MPGIEQSGRISKIYCVYIKASPKAVWEAITNPEITEKFGFGDRFEFDLRPGGTFWVFTSEALKRKGAESGVKVPDLAITGKILNVDPKHRLVLSWQKLNDAETTEKGLTRMTYEIEESGKDSTKLKLTIDLMGGSIFPSIFTGEWEAEAARYGWCLVLCDLKSLLENGKGFMVE